MNNMLKIYTKKKILPLKEDFLMALKNRPKYKYKGRVWGIDPITYKIKTFKNNDIVYILGYICFTEERFAITYKNFCKEFSKIVRDSINDIIF